MLEGTSSKTHFVYILKSQDGGHYTGISQNVFKRLLQHVQGKSKSTRHMRGLRLVYVMQTSDKYESARWEKKIKSIGANKWLHSRLKFCHVVYTNTVIENNLKNNYSFFVEYLHVKP